MSIFTYTYISGMSHGAGYILNIPDSLLSL